MKQVTEGVYTFTGLMAGRVYLLELPNGLTLVDAGLALAADRIIAQLEEAGILPGEITRIVVTHAHTDHIGGLPALAARTTAAVICSETERPFVEGEAATPIADPDDLNPFQRLMWRDPEPLPGTPVARIVRGGDLIGGELEVIATPGHTPGHISLWWSPREVLITGDVMLNLPWGLTTPFATYTTDMAEDVRSIKRLADLHPRVMCFGHGPPITQRATEKLHTFAAG